MPSLMKGQKWRDRKHKMTWPALAEIKVDEIRCHVIVTPNARTEKDHTAQVDFLSYAGKPLHNMTGFAELFVDLWARTGWLEFDLGFEANGNFNDSYRWVRSSNGLPADLVGVPVKFLLFDLPEVRTTYDDRRKVMRHVREQAYLNEFNHLFEPTSRVVRSEAAVEAMFLEVREMGHEGLMVKSFDHLYERGKRSNGWLKVKPENDEDGIIREIIEAVSEDGEPLGRAGSVRIEVLEDNSEATPHGIAHELGREMFEHPEKFIGQWAEFKYMERDRQGGYRHPVWHRLREAKA